MVNLQMAYLRACKLSEEVAAGEYKISDLAKSVLAFSLKRDMRVLLPTEATINITAMPVTNNTTATLLVPAPSPIDKATKLHEWAFNTYLFVVFLSVLGTLLVWKTGNWLQDAMADDASARIAEAKSIGIQANERSLHLEQDNLNLKGKVAGLEKAASDALAAQQRVQIDLAKAQQQLVMQQFINADLDKRTAPRIINLVQMGEFMKPLENARKRPVQVVALSSKQEPLDFAKQIRGCLDATGFSDPDHPQAESLIGPGINTNDHSLVAVSYFSKEEGDSDFRANGNRCVLQEAFLAAGIPCAVIIGGYTTGGKPGIVQILIADK